MAVKITSKLLASVGACKPQRELFAETFPDGAEVNEENLQKALEAGLNLFWFALFLLRKHNQELMLRTDVVTSAKDVRRAQARVVAHEEGIGWARLGLVLDQIREEERLECSIVAKDFILKHWDAEYGDENAVYWFTDVDGAAVWATTTGI